MVITKIHMKPGVEYLVSQGLIEFKSIPYSETGSRQVPTLTNNDHRFFAHTQNAGSGRAFYHDVFEPREAHHDVDLYRLYQKTVKHAIAEGTVSGSFEERFPCPTFESNTKLPIQNGVAWTVNLPPVNTAVEILPKSARRILALRSPG